MSELRINDPCPKCEEPILPGEDVRQLDRGFVHYECLIRMIMGCAAHQLRECPCFGGTRHDPPGMTHRQAARLALDTFQWLHTPTIAMQEQVLWLD